MDIWGTLKQSPYKAIWKGYTTPGGYLGKALSTSTAYAAGLTPEEQAHQEANDAELQRMSQLGYDPYADRSTLSPAEQQFVATGIMPTPAQPLSVQTTGGGTPYQPNYVTLPNGITYDLNDPADAQRFFDDKLALLNDAAQVELGKGAQTSQDTLDQIGREIDKTYAAAQQYVKDYNKNVNVFGQGYQLGNVKRAQFFTGLSPNAFQSSQGTSAKYAQGQYLQGLGDMAKEAQSNVGNAFLANPTDINNLAANSVYGENVGNLQKEATGVTNAFEDYKRQVAQNILNQAATTATDISGQNPFTYDISRVNNLANVTTSKANLNPYLPYTQFQTGPVNIPGSTARYYTPNTFTEQNPLDAFLGRNVLTSGEKDYLRQYLLGKAS